ncbi:MAG TPA: hypothetical protein P5239_06790, partial [Victivallales bacterium]|nr:hypothetical protein [Victivallales bacterium]
KKIIAQNAADAAALEIAVWQCRGLNLVQNINMEIYETDEVLAVIYGIAAGMTLVGEAFEASVILAEIGEAIEKAAAEIAKVAHYVHEVIVEYFLSNMREFYAKGSMFMGLISANEAAMHNGAHAFFPWHMDDSSGDNFLDKIKKALARIVNTLGNVYYVPISFCWDISVKQESAYLPIPINIKDPWGPGSDKYIALMIILRTNQYLLRDSDKLFWKDPPYRSREVKESEKEKIALPPVICATYLPSSDISFISKYFLGGDKSDYKTPPVIAYAVAQAIGGNVTMKSSGDHPFRPTHYGVGADAFLVPMEKMIKPYYIFGAGGVTLYLNIDDYVNKLFMH